MFFTIYIKISFGLLMFTYLIFLMLVLLISTIKGPVPDLYTVSLAAGTYLGLLGWIVIQNRLFNRTLYRAKDKILFLVNCELISYLFFLYLFLGIPKINLFVETQSTLCALVLYFVGLFTFHYSSSRTEATKHLLLLLPFTLPLLIYTLISDTLTLFGVSLDNLPVYQLILLSLFFAVSLIILLPPILVRCWRCVPMEQSPLHNNLEALCAKAKFRHGGMKIWTVLNLNPTAAIVGIIPRLRYVMFTRALLNHLSPECVEAVLAHEIGHSAYHHLLKFPFILLGMAIATMLFESFVGSGITQALSLMGASPTVALIMVFVPYALILVLYVRFVFGYFSRLFERQADLYGLSLGIPSSTLIQAFEEVSHAAGGIRDVPSWHHYSIGQRIEFLQKVTNNESLINKHHRRVWRALCTYCFFLIIGLFFLSAPAFPQTQPWKTFNEIGASIESQFTQWITWPFK